jgi:hypothetical protein
MRWLLAIILSLALAATTAPAAAMTFSFAKTKAGIQVVVAKGDIKRGDARRLARALEKAGRDKHGTKQLQLDSPGGLVAEAFLMADIMDDVGVTTIVPRGALCASACASVLFVSGKYRTVEKGGALAIHSCYDSRSGKMMSDCNAMISAHAEAEGLSGTTMMALQEAAGSETVILFDDHDAACFGLTLQPGKRMSRKTPPCVAEAMRRANNQ